MPTSESLRVKYIPLAELQLAVRNPKDHDIGTIIESFKRFGFVAPGILNEATGRIVVGHGRAEALAAMKNGGENPPGRITKKNGDWLVPIVHGISFENDEEAEAYLLADNRLTELGGWDYMQLPKILADLQEKDLLEVTGFDADDVKKMSEWLGDEEYPGAKEYDESITEDVEIGQCPKCGERSTIREFKKAVIE